MKKLLLILLSTITLTVGAQDAVKKVAILPVVDENNSVKEYIKFMLREDIADAINKTPGYIVLERVDLSKVLDEQKFQRTGNVSDEEIKQLGVMSGAQYVLIANAVPVDNQNILISAKIVNVETAIREKSTRAIHSSTELVELEKSCISVAEILLGNSSGNPSISNKSGTSSNSMQRSSTNQDFTETAFGINMKMIWVEGGEFMMGCTSEQGNCSRDVTSAHRVKVDDFYIGMLEVTQSQWEKVMGTSINQQRAKAELDATWGTGPNFPMYFVNIEDANEFCRLLSSKTGKNYLLPTETQWEYAARGGKNHDGTKYAGSNVIDEVAWYENNSGYETHPCGKKKPNSLGIYDMSGNIMEWCRDWYDNSNRVVKDGGYMGKPADCKVSSRNGLYPEYNGNIGFRVVCIP